MEKCDATYCQTLTFSCVKKGILSILCALRASARACLSLFCAHGQGNRMATPNGSNPTRSSSIGQNYSLMNIKGEVAKSVSVEGFRRRDADGGGRDDRAPEGAAQDWGAA
jgi:hypothetical protein